MEKRKKKLSSSEKMLDPPGNPDQARPPSETTHQFARTNWQLWVEETLMDSCITTHRGHQGNREGGDLQTLRRNKMGDTNVMEKYRAGNRKTICGTSYGN
jgi:hypothetical protein